MSGGPRDSLATAPVADPDLVADLEIALPASLPAGSGSAVLCAGHCFHRRARIERLTLVVDGVRHPPAAWGMPRPGLFHALHLELGLERASRAAADPDSSSDPELRSFRSGFWGIVPVAARGAGMAIEIGVEAKVGGRVATAHLGAIDVEEVVAPAAVAPDASQGGGGKEVVAICMATFDPDLALFGAQVESLRSQTDASWICVISDDCSRPELYAGIEDEIRGDPRFVLSRSPERIGFYRNFERALRMAPPGIELLALCDQDDRWHPDKLATLRGALGRSIMVYSDQRRVDREGRVLSETLWASRRRNHEDLASLLLANTIVGAVSLFRRRVVDVAVPFPEGPGWAFHDHWLSIVALACGDVAYVDRPLYDYVQHDGAIVGRVGVEAGPDPRTAGGLASRSRSAISRARAVYFRSYLPLAIQARTILERVGGEMEPAKRRAAERLVDADHSPLALGWLAARSLRELGGRDETLGTELHLLTGLLWRRAVSLRAVGAQRPGRSGLETAVPPFDLVEIGQPRLRRWLAGG